MPKQLHLVIEVNSDDDEVLMDYYQQIVELIEKVTDLVAFGFDTPAFTSQVVERELFDPINPLDRS